jgi:hypothetical protein
MHNTRVVGKFSRSKNLGRAGAFLFAIFLCALSANAQTTSTPNPAASGPAKQDEPGFYPGWMLGTRFEGSTSSDGSVYDLAFGAGYNFSHRFGIDLGVPYMFVGTPTAIKGKNPTAVSGSGLGDIGVNIRFLLPGKSTTYGSTIHVAAPSGDTKKGFSVGHATWNWGNHLEHGWGNFTPFIDAGVGNTIADTHRFRRAFMTFGYNLSLEAGTGIDVGPLSFSASAYDVAPWGAQTVVSRVFRCPSGTKCASTGMTTNRKNYLNSSVSTGSSSLDRDNGFNFGAEFKPAKALDLEFDYSRSVPLRLNTFSFGIAVDLASLLRHRVS